MFIVQEKYLLVKENKCCRKLTLHSRIKMMVNVLILFTCL